MAEITSIVHKPAELPRRPEGHFSRSPLERAVLVAGHGIEGDTQGGEGDRQLNIVLAPMVASLAADGFRAGPGELGEQIVIDGLTVEEVSPGSRLRIGGEAVVELTMVRFACSRVSKVQARPRTDFGKRLGFMAKVVTGGEITVGSPVTLLAEEGS